LLVLEDAHWADEMSLRLLAFLGRRIEPWPVLVVVTARQEDLADAPALRHAIDELAPEPLSMQLSPGPLSQAATITLLQALARSHTPDCCLPAAGFSTAVWPKPWRPCMRATSSRMPSPSVVTTAGARRGSGRRRAFARLEPRPRSVRPSARPSSASSRRPRRSRVSPPRARPSNARSR